MLVVFVVTINDVALVFTLLRFIDYASPLKKKARGLGISSVLIAVTCLQVTALRS